MIKYFTVGCVAFCSSAYRTPNRCCSSSGSSDLAGVAQKLMPYVPIIVSPISQIAQRVPDDLMECICERSGGLASFMAQHPELFSVSRIGQVVVARRTAQQPGRAQNSSSAKYTTGCGRRKATQVVHANSSAAAAALPRSRAGVQDLLGFIPSFIVPVKALRTPEYAAQCPQPDKWKDLRLSHGDLVHFVNPLGEDGGGYVGINPFHVTPALQQADPLVSTLSDFVVQEYEQLRVAALLSCAPKSTAVDAALAEAAAPLLPPQRDVWDVLASAPHLFRWFREPSSPSSASVPAECGDSFRVQFILYDDLDGSGLPTVSSPLNADQLKERCTALRQRLSELSMSGTKLRRGAKRRTLRQLTALENPNPFLDKNVLAQHIFDLLPTSSLLYMSKIVDALPADAVSSLPGNLADFFKSRPDMFVVQYGKSVFETYIGRADLVLKEEALTAQDILHFIFTMYPKRSNPRRGMNVVRVFSVLPSHCRDAILSTADFEATVLRAFPDLVELLPDNVRIPLGEASDLKGSLEGRTDLLTAFRFRGSLQEQLIASFDARCCKAGLNPEEVEVLSRPSWHD